MLGCVDLTCAHLSRIREGGEVGRLRHRRSGAAQLVPRKGVGGQLQGWAVGGGHPVEARRGSPRGAQRAAPELPNGETLTPELPGCRWGSGAFLPSLDLLAPPLLFYPLRKIHLTSAPLEPGLLLHSLRQTWSWGLGPRVCCHKVAAASVSKSLTAVPPVGSVSPGAFSVPQLARLDCVLQALLLSGLEADKPAHPG